MSDKYPFKSDADGQYYFWLGDSLHGPYDEYADAHSRMTQWMEVMRAKEKAASQED